MINREHIEKILSINGLGTTSPDEEIRSVLISAKWHQEDVETALTVLRENSSTGASHVDTLHNVFLSDNRLSPEAIQALLGIELEISSSDLKNMSVGRQSISFWQVMSIVMYATILAFGSILVVMYIQNFGIFHPGI